jgi:hypothetical protein
MLKVVTVQVGQKYPDFYVDRLYRMVKRHLSVPHEFIVYADGLRRFEETFEVRPCDEWNLEGYFNKLRLFDRTVTGDTPFLYLDITMVIVGALDRLLAYSKDFATSLITVRDWNYPIVNSSVMLIRPDESTQKVWDLWDLGERFGGVAGDQNFIDAVFKQHSPHQLSFWPPEWIVSYKSLRSLAVNDPNAALSQLQSAVILKFHGSPKPHEVLRPWLRPGSTIIRNLFRPRLWCYLSNEIQANWK